MNIAFLLLVILLLLLGIEKFQLDRNVNKIKIRILVNGTRGKSTVVKLISTLLRYNNLKVFSKITGVIPTYYIHEDKPITIKRRGGARVTEQFKVINKAVRFTSNAIVLECMSINPELQRLEGKILKPHIYVITNIREDHLEDMGPSIDEIAHSICSAIPGNTTVITAETDYLDLIKEYAGKVNSNVKHINDFILDNGIVDGPEFKTENYLLALACADHLKMTDSKYFNKIKYPESSEEKKIFEINKHKVCFYNGFAINDVTSAEKYINHLIQYDTKKKKMFMIFNSRADRPIRSIRFAEMLSKLKIEKFIIAGDHKPAVKQKLISLGIDKKNVIQWSTKQCRMLQKSLYNIIDGDITLVGLGNIKGDGFEIINSVNNF